MAAMIRSTETQFYLFTFEMLKKACFFNQSSNYNMQDDIQDGIQNIKTVFYVF